MARPKKTDDIETVKKQIEATQAKKKSLNKLLRELERQAREKRLSRVVELAEKFNLDQVSDTILAIEFKRILAEHRPAPESDDTGEQNERTLPAEVPAPAPAETAQTNTGGLRKLFGA